MPSATVENYLKQIYLLSQEKDGQVPMGRLARRMQVVPGTATTMVKSLEKAKWIKYVPRKGVILSDSGRDLALRVLRKHRIVEMFLVQVLELDWSEINDEAEHLEHAISDKLVERMDAFLGYPKVDPHGDPIPTATGSMVKRRLIGLHESEPGQVLKISRIKQQDPEFLQYVHKAGLLPGTELTVIRKNMVADVIEVRTSKNESFALGTQPATNILVELQAAQEA